MSHSGNSEISQYASDIEDHHTIVNELTLEHNNNFVIHNHKNIIEEVNRESINIWSKQVTLNKRFASIYVIETGETENNVFHLLKASNTPLILFDRIIDWAKRHEYNIIENRSSSLMKWYVFL